VQDLSCPAGYIRNATGHCIDAGFEQAYFRKRSASAKLKKIQEAAKIINVAPPAIKAEAIKAASALPGAAQFPRPASIY
jgi:DNA-binding transcriptional regulator LsrR (DeoR family)